MCPPPAQQQQQPEKLPQAQEAPPPHLKYNPQRVYNSDALEALNLLEHPVWVFDIDAQCMGWANQAAVELWNAESLPALLSRNFKDDMSEASKLRLQDYQSQFRLGQTMEDMWTFYPQGQPRTCRIIASGIRLSVAQPNPSMLVEGLPIPREHLATKDNKELLRGVEMLRHLPMPVCQFDMEGRCMYQNPNAMLPSKNPAKMGDNAQDDPDQDEKETPSGIAQKQTDNNDASTSSTDKDMDKDIDAGCPFIERFVDPTVGAKVIDDMQQQSQSHTTFEAELHTRQGPRQCSVQLVKAKDPVTAQPVFLFNSRDLTDALEAKRQKESNHKKSEFIAILAHEIRTPLHQVTGFIDLLAQTRDELNEEQQSFVKVLQSSSSGLMTVISDVLDYSKLEAGKMKVELIPYQPKRVVQGSLACIQASCDEKGIRLAAPEWNASNPFQIMGDPNRLRQVLLNLLSNAVKFTQRNGQLSVSVYSERRRRNGLQVASSSSCNSCCGKQVQQDSSSSLSIPLKEANTSNIIDTSTTETDKSGEEQLYLTFEVKDTGMGISKEHQQIIFKQYQQANVAVARTFGGTGLGLSICKLIMDAMGGEIGVNSQSGVGSTFWFRLPVVLPPTEDNPTPGIHNNPELASSDPTNAIAHARSEQKEGEEALPGKLRILVAEDNKVNQKLIGSMLKRLGYDPTICENGKEAVALACRMENNNHHNHFHAILMDIQMPIMDGIEATQRLRNQGCEIPILGLTASVQRCDFMDLGFSDWLPKPTRMKELKEKLDKLTKNPFSVASVC